MTRKADKRYCPVGFECGTVVLAKRGNPMLEEEVSAYLIGGVAIHRDEFGTWKVTARNVGFVVPYTSGDKKHAAQCARAVASVVAWDKISREGAKLVGWTKGREARVRAALRRCGAIPCMTTATRARDND